MLKLYKVSGIWNKHPPSAMAHYILAHNECHAVNLFYRHYHLRNHLNDVTHTSVKEFDVIHPKFINYHEKAR